ncbi:unnamed protein product [Prunus brigantina]
MVAKREAKASTVPPLSSPLTCPTPSSILSWRRHSATSDQLGGSSWLPRRRFKLQRSVCKQLSAKRLKTNNGLCSSRSTPL